MSGRFRTRRGCGRLQLVLPCAEAGLAPAVFNLGTMYYEGKGVQRDLAKAFEMYEAVADTGEPDAEFMVARMLYEGLGVEKDVERSLKLFSKAAASGHDLSYRFMEDIRRRQNTQFVTIDGA